MLRDTYTKVSCNRSDFRQDFHKLGISHSRMDVEIPFYSFIAKGKTKNIICFDEYIQNTCDMKISLNETKYDSVLTFDHY